MRDSRWGWLCGTVTGVAMAVALPAEGAEIEKGAPQVFVPIDSSEKGANFMRSVAALGDVDSWLRAADFPPDAAKLAPEHIRIRLTIDTSDKVVGCDMVRGSPSESLNHHICSLVSQRSHFRHALSVDGMPAQGNIDLEINFGARQFLSPPMPPPPPATDSYEPGLRLVRDPDWRRFAKPDLPDGEIAVTLSVFPAGTYGGVYRDGETKVCSGAYGSDAQLEAASCAAVKAAEYTPIPGYRGFSPGIRMLVRWKKGRASYQLPIRRQSASAAFENEETALKLDFPPGSISGCAWIIFRFGVDGRGRCAIVHPTGTDEADALICRTLERLRFTPELDIFGRPRLSFRFIHFDP